MKTKTFLIGIMWFVLLSRMAFAANCVNCLEFRTVRDSSSQWLRDGDPRENSPLQKRGAITALTCGEETISDKAYNLLFNDTLVFTGDTTSFGDGIPPGMFVEACTLWVTVTTMPSVATAGDAWVYDLYTVDEPWNEDDGDAVSWNNRQNGVGWITPGISGTLAHDDLFKFEYRQNDTFVWFTSDAGALNVWDTLSFSAGDTVPIPLTQSVYRGIYEGTKYGAALKLDTAKSVNNRSFKIGSTETSVASSRPMFQWVYSAGKVALVDDNPANLGVDTLIRQYIEDSLFTNDGGRFTVTTLVDDTAHNHRTDQTWWDSLGAEMVIWTSSSFGGNHIENINVPVWTFNHFQLTSYGLGSGTANSSPGMTLLHTGSHWLTERQPGETLFVAHSSNVTFREALGGSQNGLQSVARAPGSAGFDTSVVVLVDSGATLYNGVDIAPNRRAFIGIGSPDLLTWANGWDLLFNRTFYFLLKDTANPVIRNRMKVGDHFLASTWFEIGACDMATISGGGTIRPGNDNGNQVGGLVRFDSLASYFPAPPAGSTLVVDSVDFDLYLTPTNAYNIQGGDSTFDFRVYVTEIRRTVPFNEGASTYDGTTCGSNDTASTTNHWVNRYSPAYPSTSRHLWPANYGDLISDSAWKMPGAKDTTSDIYPWSPGDTLRANRNTMPPGSWTDFPTQASWFQKIIDGGQNLGFAIGQDTIYDTSNCEINFRGRAELPTTNNAPRTTMWWHYEPIVVSGEPKRRRIVQQTLALNPELLREYDFKYARGGSWLGQAPMYLTGEDASTGTIDIELVDFLDRYDINNDGTLSLDDIAEFIIATNSVTDTTLFFPQTQILGSDK